MKTEEYSIRSPRELVIPNGVDARNAINDLKEDMSTVGYRLSDPVTTKMDGKIIVRYSVCCDELNKVVGTAVRVSDPEEISYFLQLW